MEDGSTVEEKKEHSKQNKSPQLDRREYVDDDEEILLDNPRGESNRQPKPQWMQVMTGDKYKTLSKLDS